MDFTQYNRNVEAIQRIMRRDEDSSTIYTTKPLMTVVPTRYFNGKLGVIDGERYVVTGILPWIAKDTMAISRIHAKIPLTPDHVTSNRVGDEEHFVLAWDEGGIVCPNYHLAMDQTLSFEIYDELIAKGKQPQWMTYLDRAELLYDAVKFAGVDLGGSQALQSIFASSCIRDPKDRTTQFREILEDQSQYNTRPFDVIPLRNVAYGADNTTTRLGGSYFSIGMASALVNPTTSVESIESLLRT